VGTYSVKKAAGALLMTGMVVAGAASMTATAASAATLKNEVWRIYNSGEPVSPWTACEADAKRNTRIEHEHNPDLNQYYYCAGNDYGQVVEWHRHWV
jgi:hypothetical protein